MPCVSASKPSLSSLSVVLGGIKDCHAGFGSATAARTLPGLAGGEVRGRHLTSDHAAHGHLCRKARSPLATLVHQGSDPTLPHQALGDPTERHAFLKASKRHGDMRRCAGRRPFAVRWGRSPLTHSILPSSPPVGERPRAGSQSADAGRFDVRPCSAVARLGRAGPPRPGRGAGGRRPAGRRAVGLPRRTPPAGSQVTASCRSRRTCSDRCFMFTIENVQLLKDVVPLAAARVAEHLPAGHHPVGDPAEPLGGAHHAAAPAHPGRPPDLAQAVEVVVALAAGSRRSAGSRTARRDWRDGPAARCDPPGRSGTARGRARPSR